MGDFFFSLYPPILKVLGDYLELPDIIRVAATCRYAYYKWVDKIQNPFGIPNKMRKFYPRFYHGLTPVTTLKDLREFCLYRVLKRKFDKTSPIFCISCSFNTFPTDMCNLNVFIHGVCVKCFEKERNKYCSLIRVNDAVSKLVDNGFIIEQSPFDVLAPFVFPLCEEPNNKTPRVLWVRDFHKILQSLRHKKLKI